VAEPDNARPQNYVDLYFAATVLLPHHWSVTPRYKADVDFEKNNRLVQSVRVQIAKQLNNPALGFVLSIEKPFYSDPINKGQKEFQVNFMITYYIH
jgi:ribosomal protein S17E